MTGTEADGPDLPVLVSNETDTYLAFLDYLRTSVDRKVADLPDEVARRRLVASDTTLLGLVKHLAFVEIYWAQRRLAGIAVTQGDGFALDPGDTVASVRRLYADAGARTNEIVRSCTDLEQPLARGRHGLTVRWMLAHLLQETARHAGHADILREVIDGPTGS
jgi:hypothetical protein